MSDATTSFPLLGGTVAVTLYDVDERYATLLFDEIRQEGERLQSIFNLFDPRSELSRLNRTRDLRVSQELRFVLRHALRFAASTGGAYDVTKGWLFLARKRGEPEPALACSFRDVALDGERVRLAHPDVLLDLGSIAKGYIGDAMLAFIEKLGVQNAYVDMRGDLKVMGERSETVAIRHPRKPGETIATFRLDKGGVATSGDYRQYVGSYERSHIVGAQDLISVSVVSSSLMEADAVASVVFVLGSRGARAYLERMPHVQVLAVDRDLTTHLYNGFERLLILEKSQAEQEPSHAPPEAA
jgi:FAD:protein FMN transferase